MPFKFQDSFYEKQKEIYDKKYIDFNGKQIHVSELEDRSVTPEMRKHMRMNSYAQDDLPPKMTDETLLKTTENYISQCSRPNFPCSTYDEAIIHVLVPELIKRLRETLDEKQENRSL